MRPRSPTQHHGHNSMLSGHHLQHQNANVGSRKAEPYYCDRNLVQSLVRDAIVTDSLERSEVLDRKSSNHANRKDDLQ